MSLWDALNDENALGALTRGLRALSPRPRGRNG